MEQFNNKFIHGVWCSGCGARVAFSFIPQPQHQQLFCDICLKDFTDDSLFSEICPVTTQDDSFWSTFRLKVWQLCSTYFKEN